MGPRFLSWLIFACAFCGAEGAERLQKRLKVVTTFLPAYCTAANVAGLAADVENLLPGSVSLHDYQLSTGDLRKLSQADVIVINGLGLESFLDKAIAAIGPGTRSKIVRLSDGLNSQLIPATDHASHRGEGGHAQNPHIWLDPRLAKHGITNVLRAFVAADPSHATEFQANAAAYNGKLGALDDELARALATVQEVPFVTYHDAFPYFVRRYNLKLAGVVEQVPEMPPSAKELSKLLAIIRKQKVRALFSEPGAEERLARQIANDTGIKLEELDPLETGKMEPDWYEKGMRRNLATLQKALR